MSKVKTDRGQHRCHLLIEVFFNPFFLFLVQRARFKRRMPSPSNAVSTSSAIDTVQLRDAQQRLNTSQPSCGLSLSEDADDSS